jgi:hypothetical protein
VQPGEREARGGTEHALHNFAARQYLWMALAAFHALIIGTAHTISMH